MSELPEIAEGAIYGSDLLPRWVAAPKKTFWKRFAAFLSKSGNYIKYTPFSKEAEHPTNQPIAKIREN